ncbi:MAG: hypothetical protein A3F73_03375 [Gallionellales bacterium RIFCSPLOWO2_12_FULL_59_22]|nr:MAG: hypothetical protein A3H99_09040 [Gallionellales bacterium RIFCSPLOWO2_02_FULL_59_110]OGT04554.1 MAG: hypothetical protein A2Z65_13020 [Gallionellales bacterium RIFCSPLOWO2_02_58_13]OGT14347.1 MAG: hypothetical protein A3F73_03375 [Gallionellales bacterium RIFCSPLOWO2_12_FULL_59_22]
MNTGSAGDGLPGNLPILTEVAVPPPPDDLPTLTEIVTPAAPSPPLPALSEDEIQQLLQQLESRLEAVFTQKLGLHLEKLQHLAVKQAVSEFRAALPKLLRDMLKKPPGSGS